MSYKIVFTGQAKKQLAKIAQDNRKVALLLAAFIENELDGCPDPRRVGNAKKLQGAEDGWHWRVQRYRISGRIIDDELVIGIFKIGARKDVFKNL